MVRAFYDDFMVSRMLTYRLRKNLRISAAIERILPFVTKNSHVLEVGCGIGLVAEQVARRARGGFVFACDISKQNIWYAKQTVKGSNLEFRQLDVLRDFEELQRWIQQPIDLVVMVDVLEHLPPEGRRSIFLNLRQIMSDNAAIILTFPSPQDQRQLRKENPCELQPIEEVIELSDLVNLARETGFGLRHFSFEDVWLKNQYIHCIFQTNIELGPVKEPERTFLGKVQRRLAQAFENRVLVPFRRRKYVKKVFGNVHSTRFSH